MKAPKTHLSLASTLIGSLLLWPGTKPAWSQQRADVVKQALQMMKVCDTAPAQQAVVACEQRAAAVSQRLFPTSVQTDQSELQRPQPRPLPSKNRQLLSVNVAVHRHLGEVAPALADDCALL